MEEVVKLRVIMDVEDDERPFELVEWQFVATGCCGVGKVEGGVAEGIGHTCGHGLFLLSWVGLGFVRHGRAI